MNTRIACCFAVLAAGALLAAAPAPSAAPRLKQVIVVHKTHFDIGYTDTAGNVLERYRTKMIDQALEVVERNRDLPPEQLAPVGFDRRFAEAEVGALRLSPQFDQAGFRQQNLGLVFMQIHEKVGFVADKSGTNRLENNSFQ